ncbi:nitroreductase family deazaflavin-dependent oxidoreductase [Longispora fulva]|uniref:Deazaflavin-dependent oxidoreductase (Nitroreductase family) n=1 Tax=Longispora fulva TaxID=619741 RepID=A0A8J7KR43_9ACTN|nr:nitroreductase family deazaflavin-dependent oxidoreductase [Longispora fulva]MBG6138162.1 deazaflavin-dependent oxidoreductase (nitroreductase family) [Longispora fulva]
MARYSALVKRLGHQRWFAWMGRQLVPVDTVITKWSKGRLMILGKPDLPSLLITTTGQRSGQPRTNPLLYAPDGDGYVVVGSNWGQEKHPAWSGNLLAHPEATVEIRGARSTVTATMATGAEYERLWGLVTKVWPAYDSYAERAGRKIRIFRLVPKK